MGGISVVGVSRTGVAAAVAGLALAIGLVPARAASPRPRAAGSIAGVATTKEPAPKPIRVTIDAATCGESLPDEAVSVDAAGKLGGVVVSIPGAKTAVPAEAPIVNEKCRFVPRVSLVKPGGAVKMTSHDPMIHTMHAATGDARALFNVSLPIPNITVSRPIDRAGVVTLTCSTHTWMRGYLYVTDELTAVSGPDGAFKLDGVAPGTYQLKVWHEALKVAAPVTVTVKDGETATVNLTLVK